MGSGRKNPNVSRCHYTYISYLVKRLYSISCNVCDKLGQPYWSPVGSWPLIRHLIRLTTKRLLQFCIQVISNHKTVATKRCRYRQTCYRPWRNLQNREWQIVPYKVKEKVQFLYNILRSMGEWRYSTLDLGARLRWAVSFMPRPLISIRQWRGDWVGPRTGLANWGRSICLPLPVIEPRFLVCSALCVFTFRCDRIGI
jgi:hypothetical protein